MEVRSMTNWELVMDHCMPLQGCNFLWLLFYALCKHRSIMLWSRAYMLSQTRQGKRYSQQSTKYHQSGSWVGLKADWLCPPNESCDLQVVLRTSKLFRLVSHPLVSVVLTFRHRFWQLVALSTTLCKVHHPQVRLPSDSQCLALQNSCFVYFHPRLYLSETIC